MTGSGPQHHLATLERRVGELAATCATLRSDCADSRRLAYDADLRLRTHVSQVEETLRASLGDLQLGESLSRERTEAQLEQLVASLGARVQADLRASQGQLRAEAVRNAAAQAERVEALEVGVEIRTAMQAVALDRLETKAAQQAAQQAEDATRLLDALTRNNEQHAQATGLLRGHWERRENILAAVEAQADALAKLRRQQQGAVQEQVQAARVSEGLRSEIEQVRASVDEERSAWTAGYAQLQREAKGESARLERCCGAVGKEARLMQVSMIQQTERQIEMQVEPLRAESLALRTELQTTLEERLRAGEDSLAALKEHTERTVDERLARGEANLVELSASLDSRLQASEETIAALKDHTEHVVDAGLGKLRVEMDGVRTHMSGVAEDASAGLQRLSAQLDAEAEALRTESHWGFTLQGEAAAEAMESSTEKTAALEARLAEEAKAFAKRVSSESLSTAEAAAQAQASALRTEMAEKFAQISQETAAALDVMQKQADATASELNEVGSKVAGDLQGRFAALEAQIATLEELGGPALDAKLAGATESMLNAVEWKIDMLSVAPAIENGGTVGGGGGAGAGTGADDVAGGGVGGAGAVSVVLARHEHALTSLEEMATDLATRIDALDNGGGARLGGGGGGDDGISAEAPRVLEGQVAKAERRSKQAERSADAALSQIEVVKSSVSSFRAQSDASTASMVDRIETIENDLAAVASETTARDGGDGGAASATGGAQLEKLGRQVAEGLRRAAGAEGDVSELKDELATLRRLIATQATAEPPRPGPGPPPVPPAAQRGGERGVMRDVAAAVGRGPAPPHRTQSDAGAASADDDSDGDEI